MALTAPLETSVQLYKEAAISLWVIPVAANVKIWAGSQVMIDAGYAKPAAAGVNKICAGRAESTVDNTGGSAGDKTIEVRRGTFKFKNSSSGDAIAQADVGKVCYMVDDQTVAKTAGGGSATQEVKTLTPTAANSTPYSLDIFVGGKLYNFSITSDGSATATEINDAFRTAMAANTEFTGLVVATGTATLILTAQTAGEGFDVNSVGTGVIDVAETTPAAAGARSKAGRIMQVVSDGVFVEEGLFNV